MLTRLMCSVEGMSFYSINERIYSTGVQGVSGGVNAGSWPFTAGPLHGGDRRQIGGLAPWAWTASYDANGHLAQAVTGHIHLTSWTGSGQVYLVPHGRTVDANGLLVGSWGPGIPPVASYSFTCAVASGFDVVVISSGGSTHIVIDADGYIY